MSASHAALMIVFALFVSVVFGTLMRDEPNVRTRTRSGYQVAKTQLSLNK